MKCKRHLIALLAVVFIAAACGGDDSDDAAVESESAADVEGADDGADGEASDEVAVASDCAPTSGSFESLDGAASMSPTSAIAGSILDGQAYNIYFADRPISEDEVGIISVPTAEPGEVIVTVAITTFNAEGPVEPVVAGEVVEYTGDFGVRTFTVVADLGGEFLGTADNEIAAGTLTVESIGSSLCGELTYTDGEKTITAVFDAPIVEQ